MTMRTRQRGARPAKPAPAEEAFTARELDAAEQLIHLSESSSSSGAPRAAGRAPAVPRSSSQRSVNTSPAPAPAPAPAAAPVLLAGCADLEEDEEGEVAGSQRRVKRYRLIDEIYPATEEIRGRGSRKNKKE